MLKYLCLLLMTLPQVHAVENCEYDKISKIIRTYKTFEHDNKINKFFTKKIISKGIKYKVDCILITTILKVESDFVIKTNTLTPEDISIAQINFPLQKKHLESRGFSLSKKKLMSSNTYAIDRLALILSLLKKDHKKDPFWFLRYNSGYYMRKLEYLHRVEYQLKKVNLADNYVNYKEKNRIVNHCLHKYGSREVLDIYTRLASKHEESENYKKKVKSWKKKKKAKKS